MKQELAAPEAQVNRMAGEQRQVGIEWADWKAAAPVSVTVMEPPANVKVKRERARRVLWHKLLRPTLGNTVLFGCLMVLFSVYCLSCIGRAFGLQKEKPVRWEKMRRLTCQLGLAALFTA